MRQVVIFFVTGSLAQLELLALQRKSDRPRPRIYHRIGDRGLVTECCPDLPA